MVQLCKDLGKQYEIVASTNTCAVNIGATKTMSLSGGLAPRLGDLKKQKQRNRLIGVDVVCIDQVEAENAWNLSRYFGVLNDKKVKLVVPSGDEYQPGIGLYMCLICPHQWRFFLEFCESFFCDFFF